MKSIILFSLFSLGICKINGAKEEAYSALFDLRRLSQHSVAKHRLDDLTRCDQSGKIYFEYFHEMKFPSNFSSEDRVGIEKAIVDRDVRCQDITLEVYFTSEVYLRTDRNTYTPLLDKNKKLYFVVYELLTELLFFAKDGQNKWFFVCGDKKRQRLVIPLKENERDPYGYRQSQKVKVTSKGCFDYGQILLPREVGTNDVDRRDIEILIQNFEQPSKNETITVFAVYDELYALSEGDYYSLGEWMPRFQFLVYRTSVGDFFFIKHPESGWFLLRKIGDKYSFFLETQLPFFSIRALNYSI